MIETEQSFEQDLKEFRATIWKRAEAQRVVEALIDCDKALLPCDMARIIEESSLYFDGLLAALRWIGNENEGLDCDFSTWRNALEKAGILDKQSRRR